MLQNLLQIGTSKEPRFAVLPSGRQAPRQLHLLLQRISLQSRLSFSATYNLKSHTPTRSWLQHKNPPNNPAPPPAPNQPMHPHYSSAQSRPSQTALSLSVNSTPIAPLQHQRTNK
jgi:hypothetical protein